MRRVTEHAGEKYEASAILDLNFLFRPDAEEWRLTFKMKKAVFLDRDGTLIEEKEYLRRPDQVLVFPGAASALARLSAAGYCLFMVSNQSGVGRGYFTLEDVAKVNARVCGEFSAAGVNFQKIYIAPEAPDQPSRGRKPSPQFLFDARDEFGVDLAQSYMVGDKLIDLECGWNAGVFASILVRTGYGAELSRHPGPSLDRAVVVDDLEGAANHILARKRVGEELARKNR